MNGIDLEEEIQISLSKREIIAIWLMNIRNKKEALDDELASAIFNGDGGTLDEMFQEMLNSEIDIPDDIVGKLEWVVEGFTQKKEEEK